MNENHPDGFLKRPRVPIGKRAPQRRRHDFRQIHEPRWRTEELQSQSERCMDCGVPTCMGGCPIGNRIPEWNDLVYRGQWHMALRRLHATNNFPEFTGYTCPAPCEPACTLSINDEAVVIKDIERAIVDKGWEEGWIVPQAPAVRTGRHVAVVGSGPAGLAAAEQLRRKGYQVHVYDRYDRIGGLLIYGIPNFKLEKDVVARRADLLRRSGVTFHLEFEVGRDASLDELRQRHAAVLIASGVYKAREMKAPGIGQPGIHPALDYLIASPFVNGEILFVDGGASKDRLSQN